MSLTAFGIMLGFIAGDYIDYLTVPLVMITIPVIFFFGFSLFPDSPQSLLRRKKIKVNIDILIAISL